MATGEQLKSLIESYLESDDAHFLAVAMQVAASEAQRLAGAATGLSYADVTRSCDEAIKDAIIHDRKKIDTADVLKTLAERKAINGK